MSDKTIEGLNRRISATYIGPNEPAYCSGATPVTNFYTITGTAQYEYRKLEYAAQFKGLGDVDDPKPIRRAEYVVLNNFGDVVQCGQTETDGTFSFRIPNNGQVFRLQVRSRANNADYKASVLRSPESNQIYHIEAAFTATSDQDLTVTAPATGSVLGGAFNILDQIYDYNDKIGVLIGDTDFVADKVNIYWEKGFNPGSYYEGNPTASFYIKGTGRLFLLGGINGDVNFSDTDHFDNSIIAHEYFHFLEDTYSVSDSPGGNHNGNQMIDPRLAWSEGVAQYFQAVMTNISRVLDTVGNISGASNLIVDYSVELTENDIPIRNNEGEFREFSVARLLWDAYDDTPGEAQSATLCSDMTAAIDSVHDKCAKQGFNDFWSVITGNTYKQSTNRFRSSGLFHKIHAANIPAAASNANNLIPLRLYEKHLNTRANYGSRLLNCSPSNQTIQGPFVSNPSGQFLNNHPVVNRKYLYFQHNGTDLAIRLVATFSSGLTADVDLYLFREDYSLGSTSPIAFSRTDDPSAGYSKTIFAAAEDVPPGYYMIILDVRNFNSNAGTISFTLQTSSSIATLSAAGGLCLDPS